EDKLLPLITMEQAFAKALQTRNVLAQYINQENAKLEKADDAAKEEITKNVTAARRRLAEINTYMDVIYGLGGRRAYEYNRVTSEIYLRVGTVSEVFTRAIATRDALAKQITTLKDAIEKGNGCRQEGQSGSHPETGCQPLRPRRQRPVQHLPDPSRPSLSL
ncbi:MAG: hypothetical protein IKS92_07225, partial [Victivallales bacterium]|nr:hypothetical protein [Victivallales bacterium]